MFARVRLERSEAATSAPSPARRCESTATIRNCFGQHAAGGTLGILIPPSINLIVYGVLTDTSIPQLYLAGFLPGFLLALLFMLTIGIACAFRPEWGGRPVKSDWKGRIESLPALLPPLGLFIIVIGSIYAGIATPTESASLGVISSLILAAAKRRLSWPVLRVAIEGTMRTTAMILLIFISAFFLNFVIAAVGLTQQINNLILDLGLSPLETIFAIVIFYIVLGCFMETMAMMITTVPILRPSSYRWATTQSGLALSSSCSWKRR